MGGMLAVAAEDIGGEVANFIILGLLGVLIYKMDRRALRVFIWVYQVIDTNSELLETEE